MGYYVTDFCVSLVHVLLTTVNYIHHTQRFQVMLAFVLKLEAMDHHQEIQQNAYYVHEYEMPIVCQY